MKLLYKISICTFLFVFLNFTFSSSKAFSQESDTNCFKIHQTNVPDSIIKAVTIATNIISKYIDSDIPININLTWSSMSNSLFASAKPSEYIYNNPKLPYRDVLYPIALAEKLLSKNLNGTKPDIDLVLNSNISWQITQNQSTQLYNKANLISTVLHELCHGLGFIGSITSYSFVPKINGYPTIYDLYLYSNNFNIIDLFNEMNVTKEPILKKNLTDSLQNLITNKKVVFKGKYTKAFYGEYPILYSPDTVNNGSSFYHFNLFDTIKSNTPQINLNNRLMEYPFNSDTVIADIGILTVSVLADLGWNDYFISQTPVTNKYNVSDEITYSFGCLDSLFVGNNLKLLYSYDNGVNFDTLQMIHNISSDSFYVTLPTFPFERTISYGYELQSIHGTNIYYPSNFPDRVFTQFVGLDTVPPVITNKTSSLVKLQTNKLDFIFDIEDNFEVDSVTVVYLIGRNDFGINFGFDTVFAVKNGDDYIASVPFSKYPILSGDIVAFNVYAQDKSSNISSLLAKGDYSYIELVDEQSPVITYENNFDDELKIKDFKLNNFSIKTVENFTSNALHTNHPYESSMVDGKYIQSTAELLYPIILSSAPAYISYDEVVLVEPGDPGIEYGLPGFWDFVIVEGSKSRLSDSWEPLGKVGYDSQFKDVWLDAYYSSLTNENNNSSTYVGNKSLFINHTINLLENKFFRTGDTIYVRFRLQSDFDRNGWGWCIDNLKIQVEETISLDEVNNADNFYPQPTKNILNVSNFQEIQQYSIVNALGVVVIQGNECDGTIDMSQLSSGIYSILCKLKNGERNSHIIIKQ